MALVKSLELGANCEVELCKELNNVVLALHSLIPISTRYELSPNFIPETHQKLLPSIV